LILSPREPDIPPNRSRRTTIERSQVMGNKDRKKDKKKPKKTVTKKAAPK
jgi:hypothetical protein